MGPNLFCCVEVPGNVSSELGIRRVVRALGGEEAVNQAWKNPSEKSPVLRLDPKNDPFARYLPGRAVACGNEVLVAVRRLTLRRRVLRRQYHTADPEHVDDTKISRDDENGRGSSGSCELSATCADTARNGLPLKSHIGFVTGLPTIPLGDSLRSHRVVLRRRQLAVRPASPSDAIKFYTAAGTGTGGTAAGTGATAAGTGTGGTAAGTGTGGTAAGTGTGGTAAGTGAGGTAAGTGTSGTGTGGSGTVVDSCSAENLDVDAVVEVEEEVEVGEFAWLGRLAVMFRFKTLADFHCAPPRGDFDFERLRTRNEADGTKLKTLNPHIDSVTGGLWGSSCHSSSTAAVVDPLFIPPAVFTRVSAPFAYRYEDNAFTQQSKYFVNVPPDTDKIVNVPPDTDKIVNVPPDTDKIVNVPPDTDKETSLSSVEALGWQRSVAAAQPAAAGRNAVGAGDRIHHGLKVRRVGGVDASNAVAKFGDPVLPSCPPSAAAYRLKADPVLLAKVREAFDERPLWMRPLMELGLPDEFSTWRRKAVFAQTCFVFTNGPWRGCLCRFGYDPRVISEREKSRQYQTIDFRDPFFRSAGYRASLAAGKRSTSGGGSGGVSSCADIPPPCPPGPLHDFAEAKDRLISSITFRVPPQQPSQLYQLCDIEDCAIQQVLADAPYNDRCLQDSGWYPKTVMDKVREIMTLRCGQLRATHE